MNAITLVGGGLAGSLLAVMLARRGLQVTVFERRGDLRTDVIEEGRSINLALSARGIHALARVGLDQEVLARAIPMRGRFIHPVSGNCTLIPYGRKADEVIYSVSRRGLNAQLLETLGKEKSAAVHFRTRCTGYNFATRLLTLHDDATDRVFTAEAPVAIGTDGASSALRQAMMATIRMDYSQEYLEHGYKELTIPPVNGEYQLEPNALHIWPRGGFMMIALPNLDRTFTCTLFLAQKEFDALDSKAKVREFFLKTFPDAVPLLPNLAEEFFRNPTGGLVTVRSSPWHVKGQALLIGDAAHAIVPFFGQGMNAAFEDCETVLDLFIKHNGDWSKTFPRVFEARKTNSDAIARMALDNFIEMRDTSADPRFARKRQLEHQLEAKFPGQFFSKYSMVSFQRFPYAEALRRGQVQDEVLMAVCSKHESVDAIDLDEVNGLLHSASMEDKA